MKGYGEKMADQITNYKCPACAGPLHFAATSGMMECEYCDSKFTVEEIEAKYAEANKAAEEAKKSADSGASDGIWSVTDEYMESDGMKTYECPQCGASLVCDDNFAASSCPYCGNPTVVPGQFSDMLKPDFVLPFKLEKSAALEALKKHYGKRYLLPAAFKDNSHLEEIKGVYVPFWLYDGDSSGDAVYEAIKEDRKKNGQEEIITKKYYHVERKGTLVFNKIPADASSKMDDNMMDSIEPYDYKDLKPFTKAYLTGFMADRYDVSAEDDSKRAVDRAKQSTKEALRKSVEGYTQVNTKKENIVVNEGKAYYAMMPVWMLTTIWNGNKYTFAMNGQTGKMVGDLPVNKSKLWITLIIILAAVLGLGLGVIHWNTVGTIIASIVIALIAYAVMMRGMTSVIKASQANAYIDASKTKITHKVDRFVREEKETRKISS